MELNDVGFLDESLGVETLGLNSRELKLSGVELISHSTAGQEPVSLGERNWGRIVAMPFHRLEKFR